MKDIPGYEGTYKINECGNVINKNGHLMRTAVSNSGYIRTALENPVTGERKNKSIHRLVAETFIPNPDNLPVVMHIVYLILDGELSLIIYSRLLLKVEKNLLELIVSLMHISFIMKILMIVL